MEGTAWCYRVCHCRCCRWLLLTLICRPRVNIEVNHYYCCSSSAHLDLLPTREQKVQRHPRHTCHFNVVDHHHQLVHEFLWQKRVLQTCSHERGSSSRAITIRVSRAQTGSLYRAEE